MAVMPTVQGQYNTFSPTYGGATNPLQNPNISGAMRDYMANAQTPGNWSQILGPIQQYINQMYTPDSINQWATQMMQPLSPYLQSMSGKIAQLAAAGAGGVAAMGAGGGNNVNNIFGAKGALALEQSAMQALQHWQTARANYAQQQQQGLYNGVIAGLTAAQQAQMQAAMRPDTGAYIPYASGGTGGGGSAASGWNGGKNSFLGEITNTPEPAQPVLYQPGVFYPGSQASAKPEDAAKSTYYRPEYPGNYNVPGQGSVDNGYVTGTGDNNYFNPAYTSPAP